MASTSTGSAKAAAEPLFEHCPDCRDGKIAREDKHLKCMYCLYKEGHKEDSCDICKGMSSRTRKDRANRVAGHAASARSPGVPPPTPSGARLSPSTGPTVASQGPQGLSLPPPSSAAPRESSRDDSGKHGRRRSSSAESRDSSSSRPSKRKHGLPSSSSSRHSSKERRRSPSEKSPSSSRMLPPPSRAASTGPSPIPLSSSTRIVPSSPSRMMAPPSTAPSSPSTRLAPPSSMPSSPLTRMLPSSPARSTVPFTPLLGLLPSSHLEQMDLSFPVVESQGQEPPTPQFSAMGLMTSISSLLKQHQMDMAAREDEWIRQQADRAAAADRRSERRFLDLMGHFRAEEDAREAARVRAQPQSAPKATPATPVATPSAPPQVHIIQEEEEEFGSDEGEIPRSEEEDVDIDKESPRFVPIPSPPDDPAQFLDLMSRAATRFHVKLQDKAGPSSYLLDKLTPQMKTVSQFPVDSMIWETGLELLKTPATLPPVGPRADKKYHAPATDPMCLRGVPPPDSVITSTALRKAPAGAAATTTAVPPDKEQRRLDLVGKRVCATASLSVRAANAAAVMARYDRELWDGLESLIPMLPDDKQQEAANLMAEGRLCANHGLKAALDSADAGFRSMGHGVALRRQAWLTASGFPPEVRRQVMDLPFTGETLFGAPVDEAMKTIKADLDQVKAMNVLHPDRQRSFRGRGARGRGGTAARGRKWDAPSTSSQGQGQRYKPYPQKRGRGRGSGNGSRGQAAK